MKQALIYSLKVWLTSVLLGPLIPGLISAVHVNDTLGFGRAVSGFVIWLLFAFISGLVLSLMSFLLLLFTTATLLKTNLATLVQKLLFSVIIPVYASLPFLLVQDYQQYSPANKVLIISYMVVVVIGIWLYKLEPVNNADQAPITSV